MYVERCMQMEFSTRDIHSAVDHAMKRAQLKELKKEQRKAIHDFVNGRDVFVSLPTGYGKSFCYAFLPVSLDFTVLLYEAKAALHTNFTSLSYWWFLLCW